jgi:hypothetical protein
MTYLDKRTTGANSGLLQWLGSGFIWKILCLIKTYFYICNGQCQINATESKPRDVGSNFAAETLKTMK